MALGRCRDSFVSAGKIKWKRLTLVNSDTRSFPLHVGENTNEDTTFFLFLSSACIYRKTARSIKKTYFRNKIHHKDFNIFLKQNKYKWLGEEDEQMNRPND